MQKISMIVQKLRRPEESTNRWYRVEINGKEEGLYSYSKRDFSRVWELERTFRTTPGIKFTLQTKDALSYEAYAQVRRKELS